jgi:hypothetical protein
MQEISVAHRTRARKHMYTHTRHTHTHTHTYTHTHIHTHTHTHTHTTRKSLEEIAIARQKCMIKHRVTAWLKRMIRDWLEYAKLHETDPIFSDKAVEVSAFVFDVLWWRTYAYNISILRC